MTVPLRTDKQRGGDALSEEFTSEVDKNGESQSSKSADNEDSSDEEKNQTYKQWIVSLKKELVKEGEFPQDQFLDAAIKDLSADPKERFGQLLTEVPSNVA